MCQAQFWALRISESPIPRLILGNHYSFTAFWVQNVTLKSHWAEQAVQDTGSTAGLADHAGVISSEMKLRAGTLFIGNDLFLGKLPCGNWG